MDKEWGLWTPSTISEDSTISEGSIASEITHSDTIPLALTTLVTTLTVLSILMEISDTIRMVLEWVDSAGEPMVGIITAGITTDGMEMGTVGEVLGITEKHLM